MKWTERQTAILQKHYYNATWEELELKTGKTKGQIKDKAIRLKLNRNPKFQFPVTKWNEEQTEAFKAAFSSSKNYNELAEKMNISISAAKNKCFKLGLKGHFQNTTKFEKGHTAWNDGLKGWSPPGAEKTMFKTGNIPHNTKPGDRVITIRKSGTAEEPYIRVSLGKWKRLAIYNWENENGPVPQGCVIRVKNGDSFNTGIRNLLCITKKENRRLNRSKRNHRQKLGVFENDFNLNDKPTKAPTAHQLRVSNL